MFGQSNPFGQSTNSPFGSQSVFGQTNNNPSSNPFAPKPFGSTTPFGAQTGGSLFGGTSTGVFGAQSSSPLPSTPTFGASSSPAFGSSMPAFGASSTPAFGTSVFGQKPAFGGFGSSTTTQTSPFGGGSFQQQSQPAFGSNLFGSSTTPFGAPSQPAFGTPTTPAFGATTTPAFGSTPSPAFGTTGNAFGTTGNAFGTTTPAFGASTPAFGSSTTPTFGTSTTPPPFGASSSSPFGGGSSAPSFSFGGSSPAFGQSASAFGSTPFAATSSPPFGAQSSQFGAQATTPTFGTTTGFGGQSNFGGQQRGGSRVTPYTPTPETESGSGAQAGKLESISAMQVYKDKSHEELRWEDYQLGDKGGPNPAGQSTGGIGFGVTNTQQPNPFGGAQGFTQPVANPFSSATSTNPFAPKPQALTSTGFGSTTSTFGSSSPFGTSTTSNPFGSSTQSTTTSLFGTTTGFGSSTSPSLFGTTSGFGSSTSIFGSTSAQGTTNAFNSGLNFGNTQSSPLFQSTTSSLGQTTSPFGQQTGSAFGQTGSAFGQTGAAFGQSNLFSSPSTGFGGNLFSTTSSLTTNNTGFNQANPALTTPFQSAQPSQTTSAFGFNNFGQTQAVGQGGFGGGTPNMFGQSNFGPVTTTQSIAVAQPTSVTNPFGTLPAMPQMSIGRAGTSPSIQYGISSLPVVDKPAPVRISSLLTSRHLSQRRIRLPARKYHPKCDGPKIPFFSDDEETQSTPKADALFVPRENPRALVIRPLDQWTGRVASVKMSPSKEKPATDQENGKVSEGVFAYTNGFATEHRNEVAVENGNSKAVKVTQKSNGTHQEEQKGDSYITLTGHRAGEAAIVYEHGADIEALMPKLRHSDYYTEPRIQELAAKERAEPGFCRHVKEFVVGRHGYGSIKFLGETDVRRLELESLIQFNHREVIVYMDESKKPPVGQGLNKHAEVTLLNIKCFDKKTGQHFTQGHRIEKYKEMLKKKAEDQGAEFVSYDPVKGEWKFRVNHFSAYSLQDEDEDHLSSG